MKNIRYKVLIVIAFLSGVFQTYAQERNLTDEERQAELDSIIAETERHLRWNDDAYSVKAAKEKWLLGDAKLLLHSGIASAVYVGQEQFLIDDTVCVELPDAIPAVGLPDGAADWESALHVEIMSG